MFRGDRLKDLRENKKFSQVELGKRINKTHATVNRHENNVSEPDTDTVDLYCSIFEVSSDYLLGKSDIKKFEIPFGAEKADGLLRLPVLGVITEGYTIYLKKHIIGYEEIASKGLPESELFFFKVPDNSMNLDRVNANDTVLVQRQETVENGEIAVVLVKGEKATIKKFYKGNDGTVTLMPHSSYPEYLPRMINLKNASVTVIGKVIRNIICL